MINSSLSGILQDSIGRQQCRQILLVSRVGTMVASAVKDSTPISQTLGPIVASTFSTGGELSRQLGMGKPNFHLQRGRRRDLLLCPMPGGMILAATFPTDIEEKSMLALASHLTEQIEALTPANEAFSDRQSLEPELMEDASVLLDQLFAPAT